MNARSETDQIKIDLLEEQLNEVKSKDEELSGNYETVCKFTKIIEMF